jgi:hypothetical protein
MAERRSTNAPRRPGGLSPERIPMVEAGHASAFFDFAHVIVEKPLPPITSGAGFFRDMR